MQVGKSEGSDWNSYESRDLGPPFLCKTDPTFPMDILRDCARLYFEESLLLLKELDNSMVIAEGGGLLEVEKDIGE